MIHFVVDLADPRLDDYRDIKDRSLHQDGGKLVAESEMVVRKLLASGLKVQSLLLTAPRLSALETVLSPELPVYVAPQNLFDAIVGFHVHRGCLAIATRPHNVQVPDDAHTIVVLENLVDPDNVGALARNAAAFGADALVLSPRCSDPFYRKAIRTSAGCVFALPIVRAAHWPEDLVALRQRLGFSLVGAVLDPTATPIASFARPPRIALALGTEGTGLSLDLKHACDALVTIPMLHPLVDSLNVATAGAVLLHHLTQPPPL